MLLAFLVLILPTGLLSEEEEYLLLDLESYLA